MAFGLRTTELGSANKNYRNAASRVCQRCGQGYASYNKTGKYCSFACYSDFRRTSPIKQLKLKLVKPERQKKYPIPGGSVSSVCLQCGKEIRYSPSQSRKYCSYKCHLDSGGALRAGLASSRMTNARGVVKKDANHREIVAAFRKLGAGVVDLSPLGYGVPDLLVGTRRLNYLVEIKNPGTSYGRRGGNPLQIAWANGWPSPVYVVEDTDDVLALVNGRFSELEIIEAISAVVHGAKP